MTSCERGTYTGTLAMPFCKAMAFLTLGVAVTILYVAQAADQALEIDLKGPVMDVSPMAWGIFFEEINHAGDGLFDITIRNSSC